MLGHLRVTKVSRTQLLMLQNDRKNRAVTKRRGIQPPSKTKTNEADKVSSRLPELRKNTTSVIHVDQPKALLPTNSKLPLRSSPNFVSQSSTKVRKEKNLIPRSQSDTLVARLGALSLSSPTSRLTGSHKSGRRLFSTFNPSSLDEIAEHLRKKEFKNVIVMAGAGISTPSGIPDFRSPGTGLYDNLDEYSLPDPAAVFDIHFFSYNPKPFFQLAKELYPGRYKPNLVHYFIRMLHEKRVLLKMYTQNIDGLERAAGIPETKLIEAHGSFATATCRKCKTSYIGGEILDDVMKKSIPKCRELNCLGVIKPDIVFFGEDLPKKFFEYPKHFGKCDLLIVLGTSLEVEPFAGLAQEVSLSTPRLLINRTVVGPFVKRKKRMNDVIVKGDIVNAVEKFVDLLGWTKELDKLMKEELGEKMAKVKATKDSECDETSCEAINTQDMNKEELSLFRLGISSEHSDKSGK